MAHEQTANVLGRLVALGATYGIDLTRLIERSSVIAPELADLAVVAVPHTFDRIAVLAQLKRAAIVRALALVDTPQLVRVDALAAGADTTGAVVELETVPGEPARLAVAFQALGRRTLDTDLARLAKLGASVDRAREIAVALGGERHLVGVTDRDDGRGNASWTLQIEQPAGDDAATRARLDRAAELLGVTRAQRNMVAGLHDVLAHGRESFALVHVRPAGVELAVLWGVVPWEHVVRLVLQFYGGDAPTKLGEFAGAVDSEVAAMIEIVLGSAEPPAMRVAAAIGKGWS